MKKVLLTILFMFNTFFVAFAAQAQISEEKALEIITDYYAQTFPRERAIAIVEQMKISMQNMTPEKKEQRLKQTVDSIKAEESRENENFKLISDHYSQTLSEEQATEKTAQLKSSLSEMNPEQRNKHLSEILKDIQTKK